MPRHVREPWEDEHATRSAPRIDQSGPEKRTVDVVTVRLLHLDHRVVDDVVALPAAAEVAARHVVGHGVKGRDALSQRGLSKPSVNEHSAEADVAVYVEDLDEPAHARARGGVKHDALLLPTTIGHADDRRCTEARVGRPSRVLLVLPRASVVDASRARRAASSLTSKG